jgi:hypothetical protein
VAPLSGDSLWALRRCHGYRAVADDGLVGEIETPLFPTQSDIPHYLLIRGVRGRRLSLPVGAVRAVSVPDRLVLVHGTVADTALTSASLPLSAQPSREPRDPGAVAGEAADEEPEPDRRERPRRFLAAMLHANRRGPS